MCLQFLGDVWNYEDGIGFKVVRKTDDPNIFLPLWPYLTKLGGCIYPKNNLETFQSKIKYFSGRRIFAQDKDKKCLTTDGKYEYNAGIHIFRHFYHAFRECEMLEHLSVYIFKVEYFNASYMDYREIVVDEVHLIKREEDFKYEDRKI